MAGKAKPKVKADDTPTPPGVARRAAKREQRAAVLEAKQAEQDRLDAEAATEAE